MTTVRDILTDSMIEIGALDPAEAISSSQAVWALRHLNGMLESWQNDDLLIYTVDRSLFSTVANQQSYTIGVGGDWVTTEPIRPGQIDMVSAMVGTVEIPISVLNDEQWRDVTLKDTLSSFPLMMWNNGNYPLNTLYFWPKPTGVYSIVLYMWGQVASFADVNATVSLPKGYRDALVFNLAKRLASGMGLQASPNTMDEARKALSFIKKMNWEPVYRAVDSALIGNHNNIAQRSRGMVVD